MRSRCAGDRGGGLYSDRVALGNETSQTLDRGVRLLQLLADSGSGGLSITDLAGRLGVGRPVVYRLVATFADHDLVRRTDDGRVRLGLGVLRLSSAVQPGLRAAARPVLRELAETAGATAHLTIVDGGEALAVATVEPSWTDYHVSYRVGTRHPIGQGAAGKAIAAGRTGAVGAVSSIGELQAGARGVAAPVLGVAGLEASIGVVTVGELDDAVVVRSAGLLAGALTVETSTERG